MTVDRPDPEALLKKVMAEEERSSRGRLKLFLGYASRVGKTQKMLDELRRRRERGQDVVVGWIQEDDDPQVRHLLLQLETIPPRWIKGEPEMDVDAIVRRHPQVCAVDGLAHTNAPGSPNTERWQDVEQLLAAGINVMTAVNVQYIEGLQDEIEQLLGVRKQVSVPDTFIRKADEVVLIDVSEIDVEERLARGHMRSAPSLTPVQLSSLREMALLYTADTIDQAVEEYRHEHHIEHVWGTQERIMVCITAHGRGPGLVERGRRTAERLHAQLFVVYVTPDAEWSNVGLEQRMTVQNTLALARTYQAHVEVLESHDAARAILDYAHHHHITQIYLGHSARMKLFGPLTRSVVGRVLRGAEGIDVHVASDLPPPPSQSQAVGTTQPDLPPPTPRRRKSDRARKDGASTRGHLKVYLGYAAGVGKTYQMLSDGNAMLQEGRDVVIGYFEPHGRTDTIKQIDNLETIRRRSIEYRGKALEEMDLPAVLERKPAICLVDELAHTNVPGLEHEKRWQDVETLRDAGIDVMTTVNIQHLESLNDCIFHVTGVRVRETVPDWVVSDADEVVVVDVTTRALLNRLKRGVVYSPEKAQHALNNFFKEGSLSALRELALRQTADSVESFMHRNEEGPQRTPDGVMACIGDRTSGATLVRRAKRMADRLGARCYVVHIYDTPRWEDVEEASRAQVEHSFGLARMLNIETCLLAGKDVAKSLVAFARDRQITQIFLGRAVPLGWRGWFNASIVERVIRQTSGVDVHVVADR